MIGIVRNNRSPPGVQRDEQQLVPERAQAKTIKPTLSVHTNGINGFDVDQIP